MLVLIPAAVALTGCASPELSLDDVTWIPGQPTYLRAYVERKGWLGLRDGTENIDITFHYQGQQIATCRTNNEGYCELDCDLSRSGGKAPIVARARLNGKVLEDGQIPFLWQADRTIVAVDIDGTISRTDYDDLILKPIDRESVPLPGAVEALNELADTFHIVYVTARPRFTHDKTVHWLRLHGYPKGPLYTSPTLSELIDQGRYKTRFLARVRHNWPHLLIGIGDTSSDRKAYRRNDMLAIILKDDDDDDDDDEDDKKGSPIIVKQHVIRVTDWYAINLFFHKNHELLAHPGSLRTLLAGDSPGYDD